MSSIILRTASRALFQTIVVFSLFLLFAGHNQPGGGFIGGLVAATALVLRYVAEGADDARAVIPARATTLLGAGLAVAMLAGLVGPLTGGALLESVSWDLHDVPVLGDVHVSTVLAFDIGVYLVVVGTVYAILETLGAEMDA